MEKKRYFRGFLASLFVLFFTGTALAEGYTCPDSKQYTSCNAGYYLNGTGVGNSCASCSAANNTSSTQACSTPTSIANGTRVASGTQTCNGKYTGGNAGSDGISQCTGCSSYGACNYTSYTCNCDTGYHSEGSGASCTCVQDCSTNKACSSLGSEWSGTYNECTGDQGSKCSKSCSVACSGNNTSACPAHATCTYDTTKTYSGTQYYGGSCNASGTCPVKTFTCDNGYTKTSDGTACTEATYTISYTLNDGTQASNGVPTSYKYGTGTTINGIPTRSGYTFAGWCTDSGLTSCAMTQNISTTATGNKTFYAKWSQCTPCAAGTGASCSLTVTNNACVYTTACLPGYSGIANNGKYNPTCCTASCSGVTGYTLGSYNACNGETDGLCYRACGSGDVPGGTTFTGKVYKNGTSDCKATACDANHCLSAAGVCIDKPLYGACSGNPSEPITCNAGYELSSNGLSCNPKKYTVTYSCGDGTGTKPSNGTAEYNASFTPAANTCTRANWVFNGWLISGTSTVKQPGANFTWQYLENKTFTAQWIQTPGNCTTGQYYDGTSCQTCPTGYTSDAGADAQNKCYKTCSEACTPGTCPAHSSRCTWKESVTVSGKQYYGSSTCTIADKTCPINVLYCQMDYYSNNNQSCDLCTSIPGTGGQFDQSRANNSGGPSVCYAACFMACEHQTCPLHAQCTHKDENTSAGGRYYPDSATCKIISPTNCEMTWTCDAGYKKNASAGTCDPDVFAITLNANGGSGDITIYQKYTVGWFSNAAATTDIAKAPLPTRTNWSFLGYFTAASGGDKIIDADGTLPANTKYTANATLYAQWSQNTTECQSGKYYNGTTHVTCPAGKFCPGSGSTPIGTAGCATDCPTDAAGGTVSSEPGSSENTACFTVRKNQNLPDGSGRGDQTCLYKPTELKYSNSCTINITACNAGYWREQENSTTCSSTDIGEYSPANDLDRHLCSDLRGAAANVTTAAKNSTAATDCYNPCGNIGITNGTRVPTNTKEFYNGTQIPACTYTTNCNAGYKASGETCEPNVYTITLNHNGGTSTGPNKIYLKYATGWYSDESAKVKIESVAIPSNGDGKTFEGYTSTGGDIVVGSDGKLTTNYTIFTSNATITATYGNRQPQHCNAGTYYAGTGTSCTKCPAGSYCPGVDTFVGVGTPRGINTCASLGGTYTHADGAAATVVTSAAGAGAATDCYATNVAYTSTTNKATGSQTCYFNQATTAYTDLCTDVRVLSCVGGYWLKNTSDTDCIKVGTGYYSAPNATGRKACPNLDSTTGVTTKSEISETVQQCYLGNIWYQGQHSGHRRSCFHTDNENDTNVSTGYSYNCDVSVIVTCDAGYYDDGSYTVNTSDGPERDCKPITDKNSFSPAQSYFTDEAAQPNQETPGSSTKLHSCPETQTIANGTARRVFSATWNAADYAVCEYKAATCDEGYRAVTSGTVAKCVWDDPDACPEGFYCPDNSEEPLECPTDKNGRAATTEIGAKTIEECFIKYDPYAAFQNGTGSATCNYSGDSKDYTRCHDITAKTCNAGYYYRDAGSATCVEVVSGNYSPAGNIIQTPCPTGGNGSNQFAANWDACYKNCDITVAHSETVAAKAEKVFGTSANAYATCEFHVTCKTGYSPTNNDTAAPTCDANRYTITLDKNGGTGDVAASIQCTFDSGACALPATTGLTRAGYSVGAKWCTASDGTGTCYSGGTTVTTNISATGVNTTLYAIWTPNVYEITLKHADATVAGEPATVYLKYATGWFTDKAATLPQNRMNKTPEKAGYEFAGYKAANNTPIVDANGIFQTTEAALTFTTAPANITVVWSAGNTHCDAGTYYQGTGATCLPCTDDHYCPGGSFATDAGQAGINECRDNGKTGADAKASSETQCFKENLPTYVATHGTGTQKCYFDTESLTYSANCTDKYITACDAGYWQANKAIGQEAPDCEAVSNGYFSPDGSIDRTACPNGGTTSETTAASVQRCFKTGLDYTATFGTGTQRCYYSSGDDAAAIYNRDCDTKTITKCRGGYWLDTDVTEIDCSPVGMNYYSETDDTERHACEGGGKTNSEITSSPLACYKDSEPYSAEHGGGFRTCYYTSGTGAGALYETSCETPTLTYCNGGYYAEITINPNDCIAVGYGFWSPAPKLERTQCGIGETTATATSTSADACYTCPPGQICEPGNGNEPQTCAKATGGTHPNSDAGNTDVDGCWRDCAMAPNAEAMSGHDYYGNPDTCAIKSCKAGYTYNATTQTCDTCPEGSYCESGNDEPVTCPESHPFSAPNTTSVSGCYAKCEAYELNGGTAIPRADKVFHPAQCEFDGKSITGNPCDIVGDKCVESSCNSDFELIGGVCVPCNREYALSYKPTGNCMVASCINGYHPNGQKCESNVRECPAPNATVAEQRWDFAKNSFGTCTIVECDYGYHIASNACVADERVCVVEHGTGTQEWNSATNSWTECVATSCEPGYTNDPSETNERTKQCGQCKNKFSVLGEQAASTYIQGCEIASCMYQGELYDLENNECVPICSINGKEDETGTMKWDPSRKKCVRTCKEGYTMW